MEVSATVLSVHNVVACYGTVRPIPKGHLLKVCGFTWGTMCNSMSAARHPCHSKKSNSLLV